MTEEFEKAETHEHKEAYTPARLSQIILWSFFVSQGDGNFQYDILNAFVVMHPEAVPAIKEWGTALGFTPPSLEHISEEDQEYFRRELRHGHNRQVAYDILQARVSIGAEAYANDEVVRNLERQAKGFMETPWHPVPRIVSSKNTEPEQDVTRASLVNEEIEKRVTNLFLMAWVQEDKTLMPNPETEESAVAKFAYKCISRDSNRALMHIDRNDEAKLEQRKARGISFVCKYALSKNRASALQRFPLEIRQLWEAAGDLIRDDFEKVQAVRQVDQKNKLQELIRLWKEDTGEEISLE